MPIDIGCARCGYGLMGEPFAAACPQCEVAISSSVQPGDLLLAEERHLGTMSRGLALVLGGLIAQILSVLSLVAVRIVLTNTSLNLSHGAWEAVSAIAGTVVAIVIAQGWWMFTEPRSGESNQVRGVRQLVRAAVLMHAVFTGVALLGQWLIVTPGLTKWQTQVSMVLGVSGFAALATLAMQFFAVMTYARLVARGLRSMDLARLIYRRTWSIPLWFTLGMVLLGLGPLIAFIQYYTVIGKIRARLRAVVRAHRIAAMALTG